MIYSTNRTSALSESALDANVNESYFGIGAQDFYQECAQDELSIFEMAIKSDIDEALIGESSSELEALNEGFFESAKKKIIEMMEKFKAWIAAVTRSAFAKLYALLVHDNEKFVKMAEKQIAKMPNHGKFKYSGKVVEHGADKVLNDWATKIDGLAKAADDHEITMDKAENLIKECENAKKSLDDAVKECTADVKDAGTDVVKDQITQLKTLSKKDLKDTKDKLKKDINTANSIIKNIKSEKEPDGKDEKLKDNFAARSKLASAYKLNAQELLKVEMSLLKTLAKIARKPIAKAMGATPKNEGVEFNEELNDALIEAAEYEYDNALEEMSEGCKNEESDDVDDDFDSEDED